LKQRKFSVEELRKLSGMTIDYYPKTEGETLWDAWLRNIENNPEKVKKILEDK